MTARTLPSLADFILMLQQHRFSFTIVRLDQFVKAEARENEFFAIGWSGGDEYMAALMVYKSKALHEYLTGKAKPEIVQLGMLSEQQLLEKYLVDLGKHEFTFNGEQDSREHRRWINEDNRLRKLAQTKQGEFLEAYQNFCPQELLPKHMSQSAEVPQEN